MSKAASVRAITVSIDFIIFFIFIFGLLLLDLNIRKWWGRGTRTPEKPVMDRLLYQTEILPIGLIVSTPTLFITYKTRCNADSYQSDL